LLDLIIERSALN